MTLRLNGATSGYTEIDAPAVAGNNNLKLPGGNGSDGNILGTDGAGNLSWVNGRMVLETAKASTSGTFVDFTGIPSWVKRVTVMFDGVSTNGSSFITVRLGSSGTPQSTGYLVSSSSIGNGGNPATTNTTSGFELLTNSASYAVSGQIAFSNLSGNTWVGAANANYSNALTATMLTAGTVALSGVLNMVRITTVNGTDTFDAGSINILYEG